MDQQITSPEAFFGFQLGSDWKMARWNQIVDYFRLLEQQSDKIQVIDMGPSTEGHPFLFVVISSPENLANLERLREVNAQIKDPRGVSEAVINSFVEEGKAIILQSMGLHATEIGSTQMVSELAYDQITRTDEEATRILDNVISLIVPCFNPDGQIMVTDWYNRYVGTEYEGSTPPWLYHKYAGHDNNRDAFMFNLVESQYMAQIMYKECSPMRIRTIMRWGATVRVYGFVPIRSRCIRTEIRWSGGRLAGTGRTWRISWRKQVRPASSMRPCSRRGVTSVSIGWVTIITSQAC